MCMSKQSVISPDPQDKSLSKPVSGVDHTGSAVKLRVITEKPLTLFLNSQEVVTMMTIGDHPEFVAVG